MEKGLTIALAIAALFLIVGATATRFDAVWAAAFGSFGLLIVVFCVGVLFAAQALKETEERRER